MSEDSSPRTSVPPWFVAATGAAVLAAMVLGSAIAGWAFWEKLTESVATWGLFTLLAGVAVAWFQARSRQRWLAEITEPYRDDLAFSLTLLGGSVPIIAGALPRNGDVESKVFLGEVVEQLEIVSHGDWGKVEASPEEKERARGWLLDRLSPIGASIPADLTRSVYGDLDTALKAVQDLRRLGTPEVTNALREFDSIADGLRTSVPKSRQKMAELHSGDLTTDDKRYSDAFFALQYVKTLLDRLEGERSLAEMHLGSVPRPVQRWSRDWWFT